MVTRFNIVDGKPVMDTSGMFVLYSSYEVLTAYENPTKSKEIG